jgi:hypothetical protein
MIYYVSPFHECPLPALRLASVFRGSNFKSTSQIFSTVVYLALEQKVHSWSSEGHNDVDPTE